MSAHRIRRLDSKEETDATVAAERKASLVREVDVRGSRKSSFTRAASLQTFDSKIPVPEPIPINVKMVADEEEEEKEKEKMKFNMKVFRFSNFQDKALIALGILMNAANGCTMVRYSLLTKFNTLCFSSANIYVGFR